MEWRSVSQVHVRPDCLTARAAVSGRFYRTPTTSCNSVTATYLVLRYTFRFALDLAGYVHIISMSKCVQWPLSVSVSFSASLSTLFMVRTCFDCWLSCCSVRRLKSISQAYNSLVPLGKHSAGLFYTWGWSHPPLANFMMRIDFPPSVDTTSVTCPNLEAVVQQCSGARRASVGNCLVCVGLLRSTCEVGTVSFASDQFCQRQLARTRFSTSIV